LTSLARDCCRCLIGNHPGDVGGSLSQGGSALLWAIFDVGASGK
jgi:hypothetical protein